MMSETAPVLAYAMPAARCGVIVAREAGVTRVQVTPRPLRYWLRSGPMIYLWVVVALYGWLSAGRLVTSGLKAFGIADFLGVIGCVVSVMLVGVARWRVEREGVSFRLDEDQLVVRAYMVDRWNSAAAGVRVVVLPRAGISSVSTEQGNYALVIRCEGKPLVEVMSGYPQAVRDLVVDLLRESIGLSPHGQRPPHKDL